MRFFLSAHLVSLNIWKMDGIKCADWQLIEFPSTVGASPWKCVLTWGSCFGGDAPSRRMNAWPQQKLFGVARDKSFDGVEVGLVEALVWAFIRLEAFNFLPGGALLCRRGTCCRDSGAMEEGKVVMSQNRQTLRGKLVCRFPELQHFPPSKQTTLISMVKASTDMWESFDLSGLLFVWPSARTSSAIQFCFARERPLPPTQTWATIPSNEYIHGELSSCFQPDRRFSFQPTDAQT